jgi:2-amino-4-hydroxy-6-hydroxymethyldihydropteridine diphosphokinase
MRVVIGVGANLGDRWATIDRAVERLGALPHVTSYRCSRWYETEPVGGPPQPPFLNGAVLLELAKDVRADEIVRWLLDIEHSLGRVRGPERNAPRTIDLDLLWTDGPPSADPRAIVPHPRLHERPFALAPLLDVVPDARDSAGTPYAEHLGRLDRSGIRPAERDDRKISRD